MKMWRVILVDVARVTLADRDVEASCPSDAKVKAMAELRARDMATFCRVRGWLVEPCE